MTSSRWIDAWRANRDVLVGYLSTSSTEVVLIGVRVAVRLGRFQPMEARRLQHRADQPGVHAHGVHVAVQRGPAAVGSTSTSIRTARDIAMQILTAKIAAPKRPRADDALPLGEAGRIRRGGELGSKGSGYHVSRGAVHKYVEALPGEGDLHRRRWCGRRFQAWRG